MVPCLVQNHEGLLWVLHSWLGWGAGGGGGGGGEIGEGREGKSRERGAGKNMMEGKCKGLKEKRNVQSSIFE